MQQHIFRLPKFIATGLLNTVIGYGLYSAGILTGARPATALAIATAAAAVCNYFTTARLVFSERGFGRLPPFLLVYAGIYYLNLVLLEGLLHLGAPALAAQALTLPFMALLSYAAMTLWVFRRRRPQ